MIKCDRGIVEFNGNGAQLLSELSTLIHALMREGLGDKSLMYSVVDTACFTDKQFEELVAFVNSITHSNQCSDRVKEMMDVVQELKGEIDE